MERANDYKRKKKTINSLRQKAAFKNPDEFYFAMTKSKTKGKEGREGGREKGMGRRRQGRAFARNNDVYFALSSPVLLLCGFQLHALYSSSLFSHPFPLPPSLPPFLPPSL